MSMTMLINYAHQSKKDNLDSIQYISPLLKPEIIANYLSRPFISAKEYQALMPRRSKIICPY